MKKQHIETLTGMLPDTWQLYQRSELYPSIQFDNLSGYSHSHYENCIAGVELVKQIQNLEFFKNNYLQPQNQKDSNNPIQFWINLLSHFWDGQIDRVFCDEVLKCGEKQPKEGYPPNPDNKPWILLDKIKPMNLNNGVLLYHHFTEANIKLTYGLYHDVINALAELEPIKHPDIRLLVIEHKLKELKYHFCKNASVLGPYIAGGDFDSINYDDHEKRAYGHININYKAGNAYASFASDDHVVEENWTINYSAQMYIDKLFNVWEYTDGSLIKFHDKTKKPQWRIDSRIADELQKHAECIVKLMKPLLGIPSLKLGIEEFLRSGIICGNQPKWQPCSIDWSYICELDRSINELGILEHQSNVNASVPMPENKKMYLEIDAAERTLTIGDDKIFIKGHKTWMFLKDLISTKKQEQFLCQNDNLGYIIKSALDSLRRLLKGKNCKLDLIINSTKGRGYSLNPNVHTTNSGQVGIRRTRS